MTNRAVLALGLEVLFLGAAFGWRSLLQWRRTGATGFVRPRHDAGLAELAGSVAFVAALALLVAAPLAALGGIFARVRNPIFSAMVLAGAGLVLLVPSAISFAALGILVVGVALQVTLVEEPYLRRMHGRSFEEYRQGTGRFLPRLERRSTR